MILEKAKEAFDIRSSLYLHFNKKSSYDFKYGTIKSRTECFQQRRDVTHFYRLASLSDRQQLPVLDVILFDFLSSRLKFTPVANVVTSLRSIEYREKVANFHDERLNGKLIEDDSKYDVDKIGSPVLMVRVTNDQLSWLQAARLNIQYDIVGHFRHCEDKMQWPEFSYILERLETFVR